MWCEFQPTEARGVYRCRTCGFTTAPTRFDANRIRRACRQFDPSRLPILSQPRLRGLGDAVAWLIDKATFGHFKESSSCGCQRRRAWLNRMLPFRRRREASISSAARRAPSPRVLLRFPHGLGDAVQLTTVLLHLRALRPEWMIDVEAKAGAASLFHGLARRVFVIGSDAFAPADYDLIHTAHWDEPDDCYRKSPSTKAERSLREAFSLAPVEGLCRYHVHVSRQAKEQTARYLADVTGELAHDGRFRVVVLHYQGNSARRRKNLNEHVVRATIDCILSLGYRVVVLDFESPPRSGILREPSPDWPTGAVHCLASDHSLWNGLGTGDGETIAALIAQAKLFIGIDSGPGHIAGATDTPSVIVWTGHHPVHYFGLADNVLHLVPPNHEEHLRGDREAGNAYFTSRYQHRVYRQLAATLPRVAEEKLGAADASLAVEGDLWVRAVHRAADMVIVRDVLWNDAYRLANLNLRPRTVLDVGAHIGAFAQRARTRWPAAKITCVEANPANLAALSANVREFARVLPFAASHVSSPAKLISTVYPGTDNTGGSFVWEDHAQEGALPSAEEFQHGVEVPSLGLEEILERLEWNAIDVLKLDCEGCEFSLLENSTSLDRIGVIVGEFHDRKRFLRLVARRFADWELTILLDGEPGLFRLVNPTFPLAREG